MPIAGRPLFRAATLLAACLAAATLPAAESIRPTDSSGRPLNLDFETGDLRDWKAQGDAFLGQPIRGDTVKPRRGDMESGHQGEYWIGGFEKVGDDPQGTLTSVAFPVTQPWASFLVAGGAHANTRVELVRADTDEVFFRSTGYEHETLRPVVVDLRELQGRSIFIRLVDRQSGHWGHLNFDDFRFHAARPRFANALDPRQIAEEPPADIVPFAGLSPEEAVRAISLPEGFQAHLFAGEPDIRQPIAFCLDDRGRVWVAEGHSYPRRRSHPPREDRPPTDDLSQPTEAQLKDIFGGLDRILVFEDTNGDHRFDRRTVFLENLNLVSGLEIGFGALWIGAAPYLMVVPIADGDAPRPAGPPRILLDGWDYVADTHETLNTFTWGPDGWLYGCHGVFCPSHVGKPGTPAERRQRVDCAVWRYHPVRHDFEVFAEGTSNPWGIDFDEDGQLFLEACVIPHFWHIIQGARYQRQGGQHYSITLEEKERCLPHLPRNAPRHLNPFIYQDIQSHGDHVHWAGSRGPHAANARSDAVGGGHAHAGLMVYLGGTWPDKYRHQILIGNIHGQRLNTDFAERQGSGYVGRHAPDFLNFNDTWSQTLNQLYDQDGSMYIIDWYDRNQCHHNREDGHDRSNGRIYKVVYNNQPVSRVDFARLSDLELVANMAELREFAVRHSRRVLQERAARGDLSPAVHPALLDQLRSRPERRVRLRALWALHVTDGAPEPLLLALLRDADEYLRAWAIQFLAEHRRPSPTALAEFARLAREDASPFVRLYLAAALQRTPVPQRHPILEPLIARAEDATDHNLPLMYWFAMEPVVGANPNLGLAWLSHARIPLLRQFITRRLASEALLATH
ncbi:MAG: HEAT repeat domain-containing protein [Verrucomicrobiae bacterium]|nr:HEAT repeat domain-containing protein [Verrucomicrobiae bacterium]